MQNKDINPNERMNRFLFGPTANKNVKSETKTEDVQSQDTHAEKEDDSELSFNESSTPNSDTKDLDFFSTFMFGPQSRNNLSRNDVQENVEMNKNEDSLDNNQLMDQLSDIMTSIDNIRPLINEIRVYWNMFKK